MEKRKLSLDKKRVAFLDSIQMYNINGGDDAGNCTINNTGCASQATCAGQNGCDSDTPTINDNCDTGATLGLTVPTLSACNTVVTCDPKDWCGYHHETNCKGPLLTVC